MIIAFIVLMIMWFLFFNVSKEDVATYGLITIAISILGTISLLIIEYFNIDDKFAILLCMLLLMICGAIQEYIENKNKK